MKESEITRREAEENIQRFLTFTGATKPKPNALFILVMGMTGAGKSSFVAACTGQPATIGHGLESCTSDIALFDFELDGNQVYLIDTPGFNDTNRSDTDTLSAIATYLSCSYSQNVFIHGIVYLHRINDNRMSGSSKRNIDMFRALCGDTTYSNVAVATTMWPSSTSSGEARTLSRREAELTRDLSFFGTVLREGARMFRHAAAGQSQRDSARKIIRHVIRQSQLSPVILLIQHEMVDERKQLGDTSAGAILAGELRKLTLEHERQLVSLGLETGRRLSRRDAARDAEMAGLRREFERELDEARRRQRHLASSLGEMRTRERRMVLVRLEAAEARYAADLRRSKSDLRELKDSLALMREEAAARARLPASTPQSRRQAQQQLAECEGSVKKEEEAVNKQQAAAEGLTSTREKLKAALAEGATSGLVSGLASGGAALAGTLLCIVQ